MSRLDETRLENVRDRAGKKIARCPACFEEGHDKTGNHLSIRPDGSFTLRSISRRRRQGTS